MEHPVRNAALLASLAALWLCGACGSTIGDTFDDATILARVKTALANDPEVGAQPIEAAVTRGYVTLSGRVATPAQAARAVEIARRVIGVIDVRSLLQVVPQRDAAAAGSARRQASRRVAPSPS